jgi:hypothetical protein
MRMWMACMTLGMLLAAACGSDTARPARRPRRAEPLPEETTLRPTELRALDGECGPDRRPLEVPEEGFASEMWLRDGRSFFQIARRVDRGVLGSVCSRPTFEGETSLEVDVIDTILGETPVVLVVDIAHRSENCEEGADCPTDVTTAWVLDREFRYIGGVYDDQGGSASVEENKLVVGGVKRTLRDGQLVAP